MRPVLLLAAALVLAATPALTQTSDPGPAPAPSPPPPANYQSAPVNQGSAFTDLPGIYSRRQCFDGRAVVGANRAGATTIYMQSRKGPIWKMELTGKCDALGAAEKLQARGGGGRRFICADEEGVLVIDTAAGQQRCGFDKAALVKRTDVAAISRATRR